MADERNISYMDTSSGKKPHNVWATIFLIIMIVGLGVLGIYGFFYATSPEGSRAIKDFFTGTGGPIGKIKIFLEREVIQKPQEVGRVWEAKENATKEVVGIIFKDFTTVGSQKIPSGAVAAFKYVLDVGSGVENVPLDLTCKIDEKNAHLYAEDIKTLPEEPKVSTGKAATYANIRCQFPTKRQSVDQTINVEGNIEFPFKTERASLKVYFIKDKTYEALEKETFFDYYKIKESLPIRVTYNKEPVEVGIGVNENYEQPVVVGENYPALVGISLINRWKGKINNINKMILRLPKGVAIDTSLSPPNILCPFAPSGSTQYYTAYEAKKDLLDEIPEFGTGELSNYQTFECWLKIDPGFVGEEPYRVDQYVVDVHYDYKYVPKTVTITLAQTAEPVETLSELEEKEE